MILLLLIAGAFCFCGSSHWLQLDSKTAPWEQLLYQWLIKGLAVPMFIWALVNLGLTRGLPPFVPEIVEAQTHHQPWFLFWISTVITGAVVVGFAWAALTYTWLFTVIAGRAQEKFEFYVTSTLVGCISGSAALVVVYCFGPSTAAAAVALFLLPIVHCTLHYAEVFAPRPSYSKAVARIKFGKYTEAEWAVINELEKSEKDFDGWMLLAELYATKYRKMTDTAQVILDICNDPNTQPIQISLACHKLADWQLEIWENPDGARNALELLCRKLPGSHFARMAQQRISKIPRDDKEFEERKTPKAVRLPSLSEEFTPPVPKFDPNARGVAKNEADRLVDKLTEDPNDFEARERLAGVFAEQLNKPDLAIEQLNLLVDLADPSDEQKGKWLAQIATWELHLKKNPERFREVLHQIIHDYPHTSHAFAAQRRLYLMEVDSLLLDKSV
jgi:hypothetical protein